MGLVLDHFEAQKLLANQAKTVWGTYGRISSYFWKVFKWFLEINHAMIPQDSFHICYPNPILYIYSAKSDLKGHYKDDQERSLKTSNSVKTSAKLKPKIQPLSVQTINYKSFLRYLRVRIGRKSWPLMLEISILIFSDLLFFQTFI